MADVLETYRHRAENHLPGVFEGEVEELHQFRVAIRRARSVLSVSADVLPAQSWERAVRALRSMARLTSPVRDLDVLVDDLPALAEAATGRKGPLDPESSSALEVLTELAVAARERPAVSLEWALRGSDGRELMDAWRGVAVVTPSGSEEPGPLATAPAGELVDEWIAKAAKRARRRGRSALRSDDLEHWHDLRKALKRQRYLMAAFSRFYDKGDMRHIRPRLRELQDHIGLLQDIRVQELLVADLASAARLSGLDGAAVLAEQIVANLDGQLAQAQIDCSQAWQDFDTKKTRRLIRKLTSR